MITLITGGIKSGKSAFALKYMKTLPSFSQGRGLFVATADAEDVSLEKKIRDHKQERKSLPLITIEERLELTQVLDKVDSNIQYVIIDCLTLWLGNLMYFVPEQEPRSEKIDSFLSRLCQMTIPVIIVTNEVGLGIIPENKLARVYQDELGYLNRRTAEIANEVIFMVSGVPMVIKSI